MVKDTMIKVSVKTREALKKLKIVKRESYDEVINRLMDFIDDKKRRGK